MRGFPVCTTSHAARKILLCALFAFTAGCAHKVQVEAPKEPITINLNVKIEHEVLVKVDKEIDEVLDENDELF